MIVLYGVLLVVASYFVGNLDFAYIVVKAVRHEDVRNYGSGNAGTTNVLRTMGLKYAVPVFLLDALKGTVCILAARFLVGTFGLSDYFIAAAGIAVIAGHNWPVCLGFRGGKGTATSIGVFLALDPLVAVLAIVVGLIFLAIFKMVSLTSITGMVALPIVTLIIRGFTFTPELLLALFLCVSTVFQHRSNIKRIMAGTESKIGQKVDMNKKK
ncbi:glycerol-3-phosphate 1-O-acyltransferase PlsY [Eubacterium barkeri]|uniref:Glycerol-3-phosphate acyltransferase n=1 Tax=Eubacterium barkeri TaxID=1528 RepID=A0A1H3GCN0_EUBBA|nr:glycerol-3-phosphate 1-O-acyltransferase PlsY [Eubacterium barkeri]SDY01102.1 glycerol-3-phosphate acyltransferase PlsY [Eubacterium barkeri]